MLTQRNQFSNTQIAVSDKKLITTQSSLKDANHAFSEKSKAHGRPRRSTPTIHQGDLVYLQQDFNKHSARPRYIVVSTSPSHCTVRKFTDTHLRNATYEVKLEDCFLVPNDFSPTTLASTRRYPLDDSDDDSTPPDATPVDPPTDDQLTSVDPAPPQPVAIPPELTNPPNQPNVPAPVTDDVVTPPRPTRKRQPPSYLKDYDLSY